MTKQALEINILCTIHTPTHINRAVKLEKGKKRGKKTALEMNPSGLGYISTLRNPMLSKKPSQVEFSK